MKSTNLFSTKNILLLLLAFISNILMSPKWTIALAAWVYYTVLLRFYRDNNWKGFLWAIPVLSLSSIIGQLGVIPMDAITVSVMMFIGTSIGLLPFILDKITYKRLPDWAATLLLPAVYTTFSYLMDQGPQGTWGNAAYTQFTYLPLMQLASITGIYGVNFLMLWFASFANYCYEKTRQNEQLHALSYAMPLSLITALAFGYYQLNTTSNTVGNTEMATITMENTESMKKMYELETGNAIDIPKYVSQSDPILAELQKGMTAFMATPDAEKFTPVYESFDHILEKYSQATRAAVDKGAKIVTWSEAAIINIKAREALYQQKAAALADELDIYLFFPTAVFHPEKVGTAPLFIENKVLTFAPDGQLVNTYFKNIPVMGVEPSFPGDGLIPIIETPYGNLSPIICYDADHPQLIAQISNQATDMLVVPTGDWKAISPYHTHMAAVRCIENGVSMLKATSNGLSAMIDDKGRILANYDYFDDSEIKMIVQKMPVQSSETNYANTGPLFINFLFGLASLLLLLATFQYFSQLVQRKKVNAQIAFSTNE
ncbi:MAG: nitrilase-related carbon-nitrogen hydrolase [Bacteroidota bacterium]